LFTQRGECSIAQAQLTVIRAALAPDGTLRQRLERLFRACVRLAEEESDDFNVYMSALYGVNRAFQAEATKLMRDYVAVIALMLEQSRARGEIRSHNIEASALMVLSLTESYILSAKVLGQSEHMILQQAGPVAELILRGIGTNAT
jgi:Tetracyclin repressor-like, C-terminal domain